MRISILLCLAVTLAATGCGSHKASVTTSDGSTTVSTSDDGKTATVTTKEGTVTEGAGAVDPSKLGAPVYPGATAGEGGMQMAATTGSSAVAAFSTGDSFEKVYGWYQNHLPSGSEKMKVSAGGQDTAEFVTGDADKDQVAVMITAKDGRTQIVITHNTKK